MVQLIKYYHANEDTPLFILTNTNYNYLLSLNKLVRNITIHSAFEAETLEKMSPALLLSHKGKNVTVQTTQWIVSKMCMYSPYDTEIV